MNWKSPWTWVGIFLGGGVLASANLLVPVLLAIFAVGMFYLIMTGNQRKPAARSTATKTPTAPPKPLRVGQTKRTLKELLLAAEKSDATSGTPGYSHIKLVAPGEEARTVGYMLQKIERAGRDTGMSYALIPEAGGIAAISRTEKSGAVRKLAVLYTPDAYAKLTQGGGSGMAGRPVGTGAAPSGPLGASPSFRARR